MRLARPLTIATLLLASLAAWSQSGILNSTRYEQWARANVGVSGGIPSSSWTQCGSTIAAYSGTAAAINSALASCPANTYLLLGSGTFTLSSAITLSTTSTPKSNLVLRGTGPSATKIVWTGGVSCGNGRTTGVCAINGNGYFAAGATSAAVLPGGSNAFTVNSASLAQGATSVIISAVGSSGIINGDEIVLDMGNDVSDTSGYLTCDTITPTVCHQSGETGSGNGRTIAGLEYSQQQYVTVVSGCATTCTGAGPFTLTITPGIYANNWDGHTAIGGFFLKPVQQLGIENLTVDGTSAPAGSYNISFYNCRNCWIKNVIDEKAGRAALNIFQSSRFEARDSYFYSGQASGSQSYGIEVGEGGGSDHLIENNVFQQVTGPIVYGGATGDVVAYNFGISNTYTPTSYMQFSSSSHDTADNFNLFEGNVLNGLSCDDIHGTGNTLTYFRNWYNGLDWNQGAHPSQQTFPLEILSYCRAFNIVGNVLGTPGYHTSYQQATPTLPSAATCNTTLYELGYGGGICDNLAAGGVADDTLVASSLMRWGNYDVVNAAVRFNTAEATPGAITYVGANTLPASHALPASFYLSGIPSFFTTPQGTLPYPPIGPDVIGGNGGVFPSGTYAQGICPSGLVVGSSTCGTAYAGTVNVTPAMNCYWNVMLGPADGSGSVLPFDANTCYTGAAVLTINPSGLPSGNVSTAYSATLTATGGVPPYTWAIVGSLPGGLSLNASTGVISGTPTTAGTFNFTAKVTDSTLVFATSPETIIIAAGTLTITTGTLPGATVGSSYTGLNTATGGSFPYSWSVIAGALPPGLSISPLTGAISGIPSATGTYSFTVQVKDAASNTATKPESITVSVASLVITTVGLAGGSVGLPYSSTLTASGGLPPYSWVLQSGTLPPGLTLTGATVAGTPTTPGTYNDTFQVCDSQGTPACTAKLLPIVITAISCGTAVLTPWDASQNPFAPWAGQLTPLGSSKSLQCPADYAWWSVQVVNSRQMMCSPTDSSLGLSHSYGMWVNGIQSVQGGASTRYGSGNKSYAGVVRNFLDAGINLITDYPVPNMLPGPGAVVGSVNSGGVPQTLPQLAWNRPDFYGLCFGVLPITACGSALVGTTYTTDAIKEIYREFPQENLAGTYGGGHDPDYADPNLGNYLRDVYSASGGGALESQCGGGGQPTCQTLQDVIPGVMAHDADWSFSIGGAGDHFLSISDGIEASRYNSSQNHSDLALVAMITPPYQYAVYWNQNSLGPRPYLSGQTGTPISVTPASNVDPLPTGTYTYQVLLSQTAGLEVGQALGYTTLTCAVGTNQGCNLAWTVPGSQLVDGPDGFILTRKNPSGALSIFRVPMTGNCSGTTVGSSCTFTDHAILNWSAYANGFSGPFTLASASAGLGIISYKNPEVYSKQTMADTLQNGDAAYGFAGYSTIQALNAAWGLPNQVACQTNIHSCDIDTFGTDGTRHTAVNLGTLATTGDLQNFSNISLPGGSAGVDPRSVLLYITTDTNTALDAAACLQPGAVGYSSGSHCKLMATDDGNGNSIPFVQGSTNLAMEIGCLQGDAIGAYTGGSTALGTTGINGTGLGAGGKYNSASGGGNCAGGWMDYKTGTISALKFIFPIPTTTPVRLVADYTTGGYGSGKGLLDIRATSNFSATALYPGWTGGGGSGFPLQQRGWPCNNPAGNSEGLTCSVTQTQFMLDSNAWGFSVVRAMALNERLAINRAFPAGEGTLYFGSTYEGGAGAPQRPFVMQAMGSSYTDPVTLNTHAHIADVMTLAQSPCIVCSTGVSAHDQDKVDYVYQWTSSKNTVDTSGLPTLDWYLSITTGNKDSVYAPASGAGQSAFPPNPDAPSRSAQFLTYTRGMLAFKNTANGVYPMLGVHYWDQPDHTNASYGIMDTLGYRGWHGSDPGGIAENIMGTPTSLDYLGCPIGGAFPQITQSAGPSQLTLFLTPDTGYAYTTGNSVTIQDNLAGAQLETATVVTATQTQLTVNHLSFTHPVNAYVWPTVTGGVYGDATTGYIQSNGLWLGTAPPPALHPSVVQGACTVQGTGVLK